MRHGRNHCPMAILAKSAILVLTPIGSCTSKSTTMGPLALIPCLTLDKSPSLSAIELISDPDSLAATEAGRLVIHASIWENAEVQCGLPRWIALVLASLKALLNLFQVYAGQASHTLQWFEVLKRHFPAATLHSEHNSWSSNDSLGHLQRTHSFGIFPAKIKTKTKFCTCRKDNKLKIYLSRNNTRNTGNKPIPTKLFFSSKTYTMESEKK